MRFSSVSRSGGLAVIPATSARRRRADHAACRQVRPGMDCTGETVIRGTDDLVVRRPRRRGRRRPRSGAADPDRGIGPGGRRDRDRRGLLGVAGVLPRRAGDDAQRRRDLSDASATSATTLGLVTPIQLMLGEPVRPPSDGPRFTGRAAARGRAADDLGPVGRAAERAASRPASASGGPWWRRPGDGPASFPVQPLVPGLRWRSATRPARSRRARSAPSPIGTGAPCTRSGTSSTAPAGGR